MPIQNSFQNTIISKVDVDFARLEIESAFQKNLHMWRAIFINTIFWIMLVGCQLKEVGVALAPLVTPLKKSPSHIGAHMNEMHNIMK